MSTLFLRTLRDDPADAEVPSHKLLVRAGYVRRIAPGIYSWLPLGLKVLRRVEDVVREEMDAIGAQEIHLPALLPREPYEATGRWTEYGPNIFRLKDRKGGDYLLGPTHEELFTQLVKGEYSSYRDYPVILYQIQTKYRDEARPRAGILRGREFLMKDSYSFDLTDEGLSESYRLHRDAYVKIFDRLGLKYVIVAATSGAMGGSASEEFLAVAETGEDTFVQSPGGYAANVEAVTTTPPPARSLDGLPDAQAHHTPNTPTIETLVDFLNGAGLGRTFTAADTLKNVLLKTRQPGSSEWTLLGVGVPGDREVDMKRLEAALDPAEVALLDEADFARHPFLVKGYIGPVALAANGVRFLVDPRIVTGTAWVTGADKPDHHVVDLVVGRDFTPDGTIEAAEVRPGDPCPKCGDGVLTMRRGMEIGHVFQLGRRFADTFSLDALGPDSKPIRITMGSYGIGVSRLVAAIAEQHHDEKGLRWPVAVAPVTVHIVAAGKGEQVAAAVKLGEALSASGRDVLVDDRPGVSVGVRLTDAELIGAPFVVVVGRRLGEGIVELRRRADGSSEDVALDEIDARLGSEIGAS